MAKDDNPFGVVDGGVDDAAPGVKKFGGSASRREPIAPLRFTIGDTDPHVFVVEEPDAGTVMDIEEATSSRRVLRLFFGDDWPKAEKLLEAEHPETLVDLARDLSTHFKLNEDAPVMNRNARRRERRTR